MKKIFSTMALAVAVGFSASAVDFNKTANASKDFQQSASFEAAVENVAVNSVKKAPAKVTRDDLVGQAFALNYFNSSNNNTGWLCDYVTVEAGEGANDILLGGIFEPYKIKATVAADGSIEIPAQSTGLIGNVNQTEQAEVVIRFANRDKKNIDKLILTRQEEGVKWSFTTEKYNKELNGPIYMSQEDGGVGMYFTAVSLWNPASISGWKFMQCLGMQSVETYCTQLGTGLTGIFNYKADEWKDVGEASFSDGWIRPLFNNSDQIAAWKTGVKMNVKNGNKVMLYQPYKNADSQSVGALNENASADGYIILDLTNRNCVLVEPLVYSGFDNFDESDNGLGIGKLYCTNAEAYRVYFGGEAVQDIIDEYEMFDEELPTCDDMGLVTIPQCQFMCSLGNLFSPTWWIMNQAGDPLPMIADIQLPKEALASVEGIVVDEMDAPARYFNLQGVELAAPAKGEITIVKKGNKSYKEIVK